MKRLISIFLFTFLCLSSFSQDLTICFFEEKTSDLSAKTSARNDMNDNPCALLRVEILLPDVKFEGNIIGNVEHKFNEYWVYMPEGSKHLKIRHPSYFTCEVVFADYGINSLKSKTTYELLLKAEQGNSNVTSNADSLAQVTQSQDLRAIDLGLSVKWASCNIGASKPEEYGKYIAWGETTPKALYTWPNLKYSSGMTYFGPFTKYVATSSYGTVDNKSNLDLGDDAAHVNWGGSWRMPTNAELDELRSKCTWTWTTQNNVKGYRVTGPNGNFIFFPAAGFRIGSEIYEAGLSGSYWSSSLCTNNSYNAYYLYICSSDTKCDNYYRYIGQSVRPVCP